MTMTDTPVPDHAIEPAWLVQCTYAPDAEETRVPFRAAHLARAAELRRQGVIIEVGAYADVSASVLIIRAASEAEALEVVPHPPEPRGGPAERRRGGHASI